MITIQTVKVEKSTRELIYKNYICTTGVDIAMEEIKGDKENNDLSLYSPIDICNIFES